MNDLLLNILQGLLTVVSGIFGWVIKAQHDELKDMNKRLQDTREQYVTKQEIKDMFATFDKRFDRLEDLLIKQVKGE